MLIINLLIYGKWDLRKHPLQIPRNLFECFAFSRRHQIRENRFQFSDPFLHKFQHFKEKILLHAVSFSFELFDLRVKFSETWRGVRYRCQNTSERLIEK